MKKQTQFKPNLLNAQMNISSVLTKDYENERLCRRGENKPNPARRSLGEDGSNPIFLLPKPPKLTEPSTYRLHSAEIFPV